MNLRRTSILVVAGTALLLTSACGVGGAISGKRDFPFHGTRLTIDDSSSDVRLLPGSDSGIEVQRWLSGTAAQPGHSSWTLKGDTLHLAITCSGLVLHCGSRFQVAVPSGVRLVVHSGPGNAIVSGLSAPVVIDGGSGHIQLTNMSGPLRINTDTGNITASLIHSPSFHATSNTGSADIGFATAPQLVDVRDMVGDATIRVPTVGHRYHVLVATRTGSALSRVPNDRQSKNSLRVFSGNGNAQVLPGS